MYTCTRDVLRGNTSMYGTCNYMTILKLKYTKHFSLAPQRSVLPKTDDLPLLIIPQSLGPFPSRLNYGRVGVQLQFQGTETLKEISECMIQLVRQLWSTTIRDWV